MNLPKLQQKCVANSLEQCQIDLTSKRFFVANVSTSFEYVPQQDFAAIGLKMLYVAP